MGEAKYRFKPGDEVLVMAHPRIQLDGPRVSWNTQMDICVGRRVRLERRSSPDHWIIFGWNWREDCLILMSAPPLQSAAEKLAELQAKLDPAPKFKTGDKVIIGSYASKHQDEWRPSMDRWVGHRATLDLSRVEEGTVYWTLRWPGWWWREDCLTMAKPDPYELHREKMEALGIEGRASKLLIPRPSVLTLEVDPMWEGP